MVSIERRIKRGIYEHTTEEWAEIIAKHPVVKHGEWFKAYELSKEIKIGEQRIREIVERMVRCGGADKRLVERRGARRSLEYRIRRKNWLTVPWGKAQPLRVGPMEWARHEH